MDELRARSPRSAGRAPVLLGFRDGDHAPGASLLHGARVATDDGSAGHKGPVTDLLLAELGRDSHAEVYACGPPGMLEAVRAICADQGVPAQLALESGMACGYGACFGCVVPTKTGYVRLCVDGAGARRATRSTRACGALMFLDLADPVVNASGTFDAIAARRAFGDALLERFPFAAFVTKTVTLAPRQGNPPPRLYELPSGLLNSIGLPNKGLEQFLAQDLPQLAELPVPLIVNVMGNAADEVATLVRTVGERDEVTALELNVSCPNVKTGLMFGADPVELAALLDAVRPMTPKPLIVKLTPNCASPADVAAAAEQHGADAVSLINTLRGMAPHPHRPGEPWLGGRTGGVSGPAVRAIALAQVSEVRARIKIPIVGMGGIQSGRHADDLLHAGADLIAVGTESFRDPLAGRARASRAPGDPAWTLQRTNLRCPENPCKRSAWGQVP